MSFPLHRAGMAGPPPADPFVPGRPHWWQWPTVLSLDAPLVVLAWQPALACTVGVSLGWYHEFILGAGVWLAYAADRWIEGWRLDPAQVQTQRHWFYQRARWPIAGLWVVVLAGAIAVSCFRLTRAELIAGFILLGPVGLYLLSHQLVHREHPWRAPKELCVALLLAGGVACFPAAQRPGSAISLLVPLALFGLLCFANCLLISHWENEVDRVHGQTSLARQFPGGRPLARALPWTIAVLAAAVLVLGPGRLRPVAACSIASGILLGVLDLAHFRIGRQMSRALADITLMTPFVLFLAGSCP